MRRIIVCWLVTSCLCLAPAVAPAATFIINRGTGFNDSTPVAPVGGNPGTTLGDQRFNAVQAAANIWGAILSSTVPIVLDVDFQALACSSGSGLLGVGGFYSTYRDFTGAPVAGTWYVIPLANALYGGDLAPGFSDTFVHFQANVGTVSCLTGYSFYYGLDSNPGVSQFDFETTALHELTHGLGFGTLVNLSTGAKSGGYDDAFILSLKDQSLGLTWPPMSNGQRAASAIDTGDLDWIGSNGVAAHGGSISMYAPNPLEPGSSVIHLDTTLPTSEIMRPVIQTNSHNVGLADDMLEDMGWALGGVSPPPLMIPTLPQWGLLIFGFLLMAAGTWLLRARRRADVAASQMRKTASN
jgi:hypothetical protein